MSVDLDQAVDAALEVLSAESPLTPWEVLRSTGIPEEDLHGDLMSGFDNLNIWIAVGVSQIACDVIRALQGRTEIEPCIGGLGFMAWMTGGDMVPGGMKFVGNRPPKGGYKDPRFCPVMIGIRAKAEQSA